MQEQVQTKAIHVSAEYSRKKSRIFVLEHRTPSASILVHNFFLRNRLYNVIVRPLPFPFPRLPRLRELVLIHTLEVSTVKPC